jgi:hypothetical protein
MPYKNNPEGVLMPIREQERQPGPQPGSDPDIEILPRAVLPFWNPLYMTLVAT